MKYFINELPQSVKDSLNEEITQFIKVEKVQSVPVIQELTDQEPNPHFNADLDEILSVVENMTSDNIKGLELSESPQLCSIITLLKPKWDEDPNISNPKPLRQFSTDSTDSIDSGISMRDYFDENVNGSTPNPELRDLFDSPPDEANLAQINLDNIIPSIFKVESDEGFIENYLPPDT